MKPTFPPSIPDERAKELFGMTVKQAQESGTCIQCKGPLRPDEHLASVDRYIANIAYRHSGMCLTCHMGGGHSTLDGAASLSPGVNINEAIPNQRLTEFNYLMASDLINRGDLSKGLEMLRSAANSGHSLAMHDLAFHLQYIGDQRSLAEAVNWYRLAAEVGGIGFAGSQNNLGDMYEKGNGLPVSPGDAIYWYVRSAMQGEPTAYLSLGLCFADGVGVQKDHVEAAFWLLLAVRDLHEGSNRNDASEKLAELRNVIDSEQLAGAMKKADVFKPLRQTEYTIGDVNDLIVAGAAPK